MLALREKAELLLFELRRPQEAEKVLREGLAAQPDDADLHCLLSISLRFQQRYKEAAAEAEQAIELAPTTGYAFGILGDALAAHHRYKAAIEVYREAIRLDPGDANLRYLLAYSLLQRGFAPDAIEVAEDGLQLNPVHVGCMNCRAVGLHLIGRSRQATEQLRAALAVEPLEPWTHANLGWVSAGRWRPWLAVKYYLETLRLQPTHASVMSNLRGVIEPIAIIGFIIFFVLTLVLGTVVLRSTTEYLPGQVASFIGAIRTSGGLLIGILGLFTSTGHAAILRAFPLGRKIVTSEEIRDSNILLVIIACGVFAAGMIAAVDGDIFFYHCVAVGLGLAIAHIQRLRRERLTEIQSK